MEDAFAGVRLTPRPRGCSRRAPLPTRLRHRALLESAYPVALGAAALALQRLGRPAPRDGDGQLLRAPPRGERHDPRRLHWCEDAQNGCVASRPSGQQQRAQAVLLGDRCRRRGHLHQHVVRRAGYAQLFENADGRSSLERQAQPSQQAPRPGRRWEPSQVASPRSRNAACSSSTTSTCLSASHRWWSMSPDRRLPRRKEVEMGSDRARVSYDPSRHCAA